jgi:hypothetical protein
VRFNVDEQSAAQDIAAENQFSMLLRRFFDPEDRTERSQAH